MEVSVSRSESDPEWDDFLETQPDGCYQQSSLWARLQTTYGWDYIRLIVRGHGKIIGGSQIFLHSLPLYGTVGYISKGPVVDSGHIEATDFVFAQIEKLARTEHILLLKIQPPQNAEHLAKKLLQLGALQNEISVTPHVTAMVNLCATPPDLLMQMPQKTRYNIRLAERKGVKVRLGTEEDIPAFYKVRKIHTKQRRYNPGSLKFHYNMLKTFSANDHFCLLLAEYQGEILAASTNICFGDVLANKFLVDNGRHRNLNAHSLLHWYAMQWGIEHGCKWYDLGGIDIDVAVALLKHHPFPKTESGGIAKFKMSFGSQLVVRPGVYDMSYVRPTRLTVRLTPLLIKLRPFLSTLIGGPLARRVQSSNRKAQRVAERSKDL